jgi:hypothetical protein
MIILPTYLSNCQENVQGHKGKALFIPDIEITIHEVEEPALLSDSEKTPEAKLMLGF